MIDNPYIQYPDGYSKILMKTADGLYFCEAPKKVSREFRLANPQFARYVDILAQIRDHRQVNMFFKGFGPTWVLKNGFVFFKREEIGH